MKVKRYHHIIDMSGCRETIGDPKILREFVETIARTVGMTIIEGPITAQGVDTNPGFSVLAIIDYSHISIHTFTAHKEILVDVFSCKEYNREKVIRVCKEFFEIEHTEMRQKEVWWG